LRGVIEQLAFIGDSHHYRVRVQGQTLKVKASRGSRTEPFGLGASVCVKLQPERVRLMPT
jgi:hypothetical protein